MLGLNARCFLCSANALPNLLIRETLDAMPDRLSPEQRSALMSRVRSTNTRPEIEVRSFLHRAGFRFRLHDNNLPGKPDIVLKRHKTAIFVHGCFWHGHDCKKGRPPKSNEQFWRDKISKNRERDRKNEMALYQAGWRVVVIWECDIPQGLEMALTTLSTEKPPIRFRSIARGTYQE